MFNGASITLQRKGLALLGYLALEGATARERVADLLWGHEGSANNLRVELFRLRSALRRAAPQAFPAGTDPLSMPPSIETAPIDVPEELMLGLEDVSPEFGEWLVSQRASRSRVNSDDFLRTDQVEALAREVRPPHVVLLRGEPESGRETFARSLARLLGLPIVYGGIGNTAAVHYLSEDEDYDSELVRRMIADKHSVWVMACSPYAGDTRSMLEVRAGYPAARLKHVTLDPLSWPEARAGLLSDLPFDEAARYYVFSGGHLGFLSELLATRPKREPSQVVPLPQRIRATFLLKARALGEVALDVARYLSVHPGPIPEPLIQAFEAEPHLDALESGGWLRYDGAYRFTTEAGRRVMYDSMGPGQRVRAHRRAAAALESTPHRIAAAYHLELSGVEANWRRLARNCPSWTQAVLAPYAEWNRAHLPLPFRDAELGPELALLANHTVHVGKPVTNGDVTWWLLPTEAETRSTEFELPGSAAVLRVHARAYVHNPAGIGLSCDAVPLRLSVFGSHNRSVVWADVEGPGRLADGTHVLPLRSEFEAAFIVDQHALRLESRAFAGVLEIHLTLNRLRDGDEPVGQHGVSALDLT